MFHIKYIHVAQWKSEINGLLWVFLDSMYTGIKRKFDVFSKLYFFFLEEFPKFITD